MNKISNVVSVSGGKDSTAMLLLAIEQNVENLAAVFADTGHEHPETLDYLEYLEHALNVNIQRVRADFSQQIARKRDVVNNKWRSEGVPEYIIEQALSVLHPTGIPFLDLCLWKGRFPSTKARFCTEELKRHPIDEQVIQPKLACFDAVISWQGVRHDESPTRSKLSEKDIELGAWLPHPQGILIYRPIVTWSAQDVFDFHRKHGIHWNPLYEQGMGRVGCMPCVNCRKSELREIALRFPEEVERVKTWERIVAQASKRSSATFFPAVMDPTANASDVIMTESHGLHRAVEWAKTSRGGRQYDLLIATQSASQCHSLYGLCE